MRRRAVIYLALAQRRQHNQSNAYTTQASIKAVCRITLQAAFPAENCQMELHSE